MKAVIKDKVLGIVIKEFNNVPKNATESEKQKVLENVCKAFHVEAKNFVLVTV